MSDFIYFIFILACGFGAGWHAHVLHTLTQRAKTIEAVYAAVEKVLHDECVDVGPGNVILEAIKGGG